MGLYSTNRVGSLGYIEVEPDLNYHKAADTFNIMTEGFENDRAMFNEAICSDIREALVLHGLTESSVLLEGTGSDLLEKIKDFVKKCWKKIVGLIDAVKAKIQSYLTKDTKAFYKKYQKQFISKDLSKMKCKYEKPKQASYTILDFSVEIDRAIKSSFDNPKSYLESYIENDKLMEAVLGRSIGDGTCEVKEYKKEAHSHFFEDKDEYEGLSDDMRTHIKTVLMDNKIVKDLEKTKTEFDKIFNNALKALDKEGKASLNADKGGKSSVSYKDNDDVNHSTEYTKGTNVTVKSANSEKFNVAYKAVSILQRGANMAASAVINAAKFDVAQCKRLLAQAVAFKTIKEDALLLDVVGEAAEYDFESFMESYEM